MGDVVRHVNKNVYIDHKIKIMAHPSPDERHAILIYTLLPAIFSRFGLAELVFILLFGHK